MRDPWTTAVPPWLTRNSWFDLPRLDPALAQQATGDYARGFGVAVTAPAAATVAWLR